MYRKLSLFLTLILTASLAFAGPVSNEDINAQLDTIKAENETDAKILEVVKESTKNGKHKLKHKNFKRNAGKVASIVSTKLNKPFVFASGFLRGFFQKSSKNKELYAVSRLLVKHEKEIEDAIVNGITDADGSLLAGPVSTIGDLEEVLEIIIPQIFTNKLKNILIDIIAESEISIDITNVNSLTDLLNIFEELELEEQAKVVAVLEKTDISKINNHKEYEDLRLLLGDLTLDQVYNILVDRELDIPEELDVEEIIKKLGIQTAIDLSVGVIAGQLTSSILLGQISGALGGIYGTVVLATTATHAISVNACLKNEELIESDEDFARFCSYVVYAAGNELIASRSKGFVAGKNLRLKTEKLLATIKTRLTEGKEARRARRAEKKKAREERRKARELEGKENIFKRAGKKIKGIFKKS